jgi:nucleotide-binding universal stress UspA family protein
MKHILLPTDFSENSWNAISYAINLFKDETCTFHLLNNYMPMVYNVEYVLGYPAQFGLVDAMRNSSQVNLESLIKRIDKQFKNNPKHSFDTSLSLDNLVSGIQEFILKRPVNLIIMGTKGATGAKEVLFGTNTVDVFQKVKCPTLAIPSGFQFEPLKDLLFPTDLEVPFKNTELEIVADLVKKHKSKIHALHILTGTNVTDTQARNKLELVSLFEELPFVYHEINNDSVTDGINRFQKDNKINVLIMCNNKHSFFENILFKSKVKQIGFHIQIPFLVIHSKN